MKSAKTTRARAFKSILAILGAGLLFSACAVEAPNESTGTENPTIETLSDGSQVARFRGEGQSTLPDGTPGGDYSEAVDKKNCVYIQWCDAPGSEQIVCRCTGTPCSHAEQVDECFRDAQAVCGNSYYMSAYLCG